MVKKGPVKNDPETIGQNLVPGITPEEATASVELLMKLGFVGQTNDGTLVSKESTQVDESLVLRKVRQDTFDRDGLLEAAGGHGLAAEDFRHAADADTVEQLVTRHVASNLPCGVRSMCAPDRA
jgi:hypothetical protein